MTLFSSPAEVGRRLGEVGYLADDAIATTVYLADALGKPLLVEGPAGVGKTELAKAVSAATGAELVRLQCYEGLDEARALYEWNYKKQLLRIQAAPPTRPGRPPTTTSSPRSSCWRGRCWRRSGGPTPRCC
ncbi:AAA family ATPase [Thermomonospora amylolytica]